MTKFSIYTRMKTMNLISENPDFKQKLMDNFLRYVQIWSESDSVKADEGVFPSTERQRDFAKILAEELKAVGMDEVILDQNGYVYAFAKGKGALEKEPSVLLLAHMDTVDEVSGKDVKPVITQKDEDTIIASDGTTLLGADDKAGVAAIMTCADFLLHSDKDHIPFEIIYSPDEETGHGMDKVPLNLIKSKYAYTVDGGDLGEMETECFNAWAAIVDFTGHATHTGTAKKEHMVNAVVMASNFVSLLPRDKAPETTEKYQGFIAPMDITGTIESARVNLLLRSFNLKEIDEEKNLILKTAAAIQKNSGGIVQVSFKQQYLNMKENLDKSPFVVEKLKKAFDAAGVKIVQTPIRGGTDGSRLTEMGIPTPNIFTGGHNFHSRDEWCSLNQMSKSADILVNLLIEK